MSCGLVPMAGLLAVSCPAGGSSAELAEHAEAEFRQGIELRHDADQARPHFRAAAACFEDARVRTVRVRVEKLEALTSAESVGIEIERTR